MFLTYFNARHGTWFTHHLEEGSFTLRTDAQWTEDNTAQGKKKLRQGRENKKGIKVFKCNFKKILRQGSFKKNWWSFSTRKWSLPFQADDPGHLQVIAVRKIGMLKHLKLLAWFQIDVKCIVMKSNARIRSEAHPGLFAPGSTLTWDITAWFWIVSTIQLSPLSRPVWIWKPLLTLGEGCGTARRSWGARTSHTMPCRIEKD